MQYSLSQHLPASEYTTYVDGPFLLEIELPHTIDSLFNILSNSFRYRWSHVYELTNNTAYPQYIRTPLSPMTLDRTRHLVVLWLIRHVNLATFSAQAYRNGLASQ